MLFISTVIPVAGTVSENNSNNYQLDNKDNFFPSESEEDWWEMFRHDSGNTAGSSCKGPDVNQLCWQQIISDSPGIAAPIVVEDKLYLSTGGFYDIEPPEGLDLQIKPIYEKPSLISKIAKIKSEINDQYYGSLYCLDAVNGTLLWDFYVGLSEDPAVVDGNLYVILTDIYSYNSVLQCRDAETGQTINWQRTIPAWILSSVIVADGKIYIGGLDFYGYSGKLYCLNAENGNIIWTYTMPYLELMVSSAAVADGLVYFATSSFYYYYYAEGSLYCLDADTGVYQWDQPILGSWYWYFFESNSPVVADGQVYFLNVDWYGTNSELCCYDAYTGSPIWTYYLGNQFSLSNPAFYDDSVYLAVIDYSIYNGKIYRINADTGNVIWDVAVFGIPYFSSPSVADDKLYIPLLNFYSYDAILICLDTNDGNLIWDYTLDYFTLSSPAIADGRVYLPDYWGNIYAIGYPNDPPTIPTINGETDGKAGKSYDYTIVSTDPEEEDIYYFVYWGDDNSSGWIGPYESGEVVTLSHTWEVKDTYNITARAKDIHGSKSDWATLEVTMPKSYLYNRWLVWLERFPLIQRLLWFIFD